MRFQEYRPIALRRDAPLRVAHMELLEGRRLLSASGGLDSGFGKQGSVSVLLNQSKYNFAGMDGGAVTPDGGVVVGGFAQGPAFQQSFLVARFNADGSRDANFGKDGIVITKLGRRDGGGDVLDVLSEPDGKVLACGVIGGEFALAQYDADGALDPSFGKGGLVETDFGGGYSSAVRMALLPDGKIIASGDCENARDGDAIALARYNPDGSQDTTFGKNGIVITNPKLTPHGVGYVTGDLALRLLPHGRVLVVGNGNVGYDRLVMATYNGNGDLVSAAFTQRQPAVILSAAELPDDQVVAFTQPNATGAEQLIRFNRDGTRDLNFGTHGSSAVPFYAPPSGLDITTERDGKIVVGGVADGYPFFVGSALARFNADGSLDTRFGLNGVVWSPLNTSDPALPFVARNGDILAVDDSEGFTYDDPRFVVSRYLPSTGDPRPAVSVAATTITAPAPTLSLEAAYDSPDGISLDGGVTVVVVSPAGASLPISYTPFVMNPDGSGTQPFDVLPPGNENTFTAADNGAYRVEIKRNQVRDSEGFPAKPGVIGTFTVAIP